MSELRQRIDEHKRRWRERIASFRQELRSDVTRGILSEVMRSLYVYRRNPWESPAICAALEFAEETNFLEVFDGLWTQAEVRGEFKCAKVEIPQEISGRAALKAEI